ncbi:hypothetical protein FISHEDRAFT_55799 [Fistulina hepatica ATCC 64428]|uniref:Lysine-specific metallo-endopeptidase domain-containing protein n=1 Tax=Fistulina hepatica ATCC 64428 TaxID=1128425 RepID=A0A0D7APC9_9AGAR|nr:hypothetical protein FISHEDRAFT_55799 [Fistulina hepatica ATCC 64428]
MISTVFSSLTVSLAASILAVEATKSLSVTASGESHIPEAFAINVDGVCNSVITNTGDEAIKLLQDPSSILSNAPTNSFGIPTDHDHESFFHFFHSSLVARAPEKILTRLIIHYTTIPPNVLPSLEEDACITLLSLRLSTSAAKVTITTTYTSNASHACAMTFTPTYDHRWFFADFFGTLAIPMNNLGTICLLRGISTIDTGSQTGTIIHEASHLTANCVTEDKPVGLRYEEFYAELFQSAHNHEYLTENNPELE